MLEGGPLDVLTGDYLAELTLLVLGRDQAEDPARGYSVLDVRRCSWTAREQAVGQRLAQPLLVALRGPARCLPQHAVHLR
jgi:hypothetical protein